MGMRADRASGSESDGRPRASERYPRTATCGCLFFVSPSSLYHLRSIRGLKRRKPRRDPLHSGRGSSPARGEAWVHRAESARAARYVGKRAERVRGRKGAADRPSASRATPHVYKGVSLSRPSFVSPTLSTHSRIQGTEYRGERLSTPGGARSARCVWKRPEGTSGSKRATNRPRASRATPHVYKGVSPSRPSFVSPTLSTYSRIQRTEYLGKSLSTPGEFLLWPAEIPVCSKQRSCETLGACERAQCAPAAVKATAFLALRSAITARLRAGVSCVSQDLLGRSEIPGCSERNARDPLGACGSALSAQVAAKGPRIVLARLALSPHGYWRVCLSRLSVVSLSHSMYSRIQGTEYRREGVSTPGEVLLVRAKILCAASRAREPLGAWEARGSRKRK
jgi:hypothetical protein